MKSYKNWKLINESFITGRTLGLSHPQSLGLHSNRGLAGIEETKKKMGGDVMSDDCSCKNKKKKKNMRDSSKEEDDRYVDRSEKGRKRWRSQADAEENFEKAQSSDDYDDTEYAAKQSASFPKYKTKQNMKKKMKKHMSDDVDDVEDFDHEGDDDDVNDVDVPEKGDHDEEDHDEPDGDEDGPDMEGDGDGEGDEEESGEDDDDGGEDFHGEDDDDDGEGDEGDDAVKFGFMKDKKKEWKKKRKDESSFWEDIDKNYRVPQEEIGTDEEFFDSLSRQYGNPHVRFHGGVDRFDEDLLLSPDQQALIDAMPKPGEVGYAPNQRLGGEFDGYETPVLGHLPYGESAEDDYDEEDAQDFEVLTKYFSESVAYDLIQKKNSR